MSIVQIEMKAESEESLQSAVHKYFVEWPKDGYGTVVRKLFQDESGKWVAHIARADSCD